MGPQTSQYTDLFTIDPITEDWNEEKYMYVFKICRYGYTIIFISIKKAIPVLRATYVGTVVFKEDLVELVGCVLRSVDIDLVVEGFRVVAMVVVDRETVD